MILLIIDNNIPSSYDSISGTVNSVDTVFIVDSIVDNLIMCACEEASTYDVSISFSYNGSVVHTFTDTITQSVISFVTDRTIIDVERVKYLRDRGYTNLTPAELIEWNTDLKGALNESDINRVLSNLDTVAMLDDLTPFSISAPTVWEGSFFATILSALSDIRDEGYILDTTPTVPSRPLNSYEKWNYIEKILFDNYDIRTTQFKYFGGMDELPLPVVDELLNIVFNSNGEAKKLENVTELLYYRFLLAGSTQSFVDAINDIKKLQDEILSSIPMRTESGDGVLCAEDGSILITEV